LDSLEQQGEKSPFATNSEWLLYAYARLKGSDAGGRLTRMAENPALRFVENYLDEAVALSLHITS
jgi:hypothetical protein